MATMLIYLEDTEQGGETIFPNGERPEHWDADEPGNHNEWSECAKKGIPVKSHRGDAVLFWSLKEDYLGQRKSSRRVPGDIGGEVDGGEVDPGRKVRRGFQGQTPDASARQERPE